MFALEVDISQGLDGLVGVTLAAGGVVEALVGEEVLISGVEGGAVFDQYLHSLRCVSNKTRFRLLLHYRFQQRRKCWRACLINFTGNSQLWRLLLH